MNLVLKHIDIFVCPACGESLRASQDRRCLQCSGCRRFFECQMEIPLLFWPNKWDSKTDVTEVVKRFYEETPFPNYEGLDAVWSLREKAERGIFARLLDNQIPHGARILEVGCGTGQLSNFLSLSGERCVFGSDMCLNSLKLGQKFKEDNQIDNVGFIQMNLFRPVFKPGSFDLVICNGVLHHTSDPFLGFQSILRLVRKGGFIIIGLYNTYGRITTDIRRFIFWLCGNRLHFLDPRLRSKSVGLVRKNTWFMDQYMNPHESKHSIGELLRWFDRCNVDFINCIPKPRPFDRLREETELFRPIPRGRWIDHLLVQFGMLMSGGKEGGFFIGIGRKK